MRRAAVARVLDVELDGEGDALGGPRELAEARRDVLADDAALAEDVGAVRAVAGEGAGRLLGDDVAVAGRAGSGGRRAGRGRRGGRRRASTGRQAERDHPEGRGAEELQGPAPVEDRAEVEREPLVDELGVLVREHARPSKVRIRGDRRAVLRLLLVHDRPLHLEPAPFGSGPLSNAARKPRWPCLEMAVSVPMRQRTIREPLGPTSTMGTLGTMSFATLATRVPISRSTSVGRWNRSGSTATSTSLRSTASS